MLTFGPKGTRSTFGLPGSTLSYTETRAAAAYLEGPRFASVPLPTDQHAIPMHVIPIDRSSRARDTWHALKMRTL